MDGGGGRGVVLDVEGTASRVEAVGAVEGGVDTGEDEVDAGLGEVEEADLGGDGIGEGGGGGEGGEEEGGVGAGDREEGGGGAAEGE